MGTIKTIMSGCTKTDKRVQILLSTYNGEKYLQEQLNSYIEQTYFDHIKVLVRDDGSTDQTPDILREYANQYGFEVLFGENIGINASYHELLRVSDASFDYYAFSDQDDVWLPNKIELALSQLDLIEDGTPALFFSLSQISDENLKAISTSQFPVQGISFYNAMVQNVAPGHTQVFNHELRRLLLKTDCSDAHVLDWWTYLLACGVGMVCFEPHCTVLHRQHSHNMVGYELNPFKKFFVRLKRVRSKEAIAISKQLLGFQHAYSSILPEEYRKEVSDFLEMQSSIFSRFSYLSHAQIFRQTMVDNILVRLLYLLGKYNLKDG